MIPNIQSMYLYDYYVYLINRIIIISKVSNHVNRFFSNTKSYEAVELGLDLELELYELELLELPVVPFPLKNLLM